MLTKVIDLGCEREENVHQGRDIEFLDIEFISIIGNASLATVKHYQNFAREEKIFRENEKVKVEVNFLEEEEMLQNFRRRTQIKSTIL